MNYITDKEYEEDASLWKEYCDGKISLNEWIEKSPVAKKAKMQNSFWYKPISELGIEI